MSKLTSPEGVPTGAIYGVLNMLRRLRAEVEHNYACCIFDAKGKNFRHHLFTDYKATRPPMPDDLRPQAQRLPELVRLMGWPVLVVEGVEADDVIGTLAKKAQGEGVHTIISTGDKDMAQLVNEAITLVNTMSNEVLDEAGVQQKFGVRPDQIVDYLTLIGDKVDNVPGVYKCGEKTAAKWLAQYHTLNGVMAHAHEIGGKVGEYLQAALTHLPLSYQLITLKTDVDLQTQLPRGLANLCCQSPDWATLSVHFRELGFRSWLAEAQAQMGDGNRLPENPTSTFRQPQLPDIAPAPESLDYRSITTQAQLDTLLDEMRQADVIGIDTETTSLDAMNAELVGISVATAVGRGAYIPVGHTMTAVETQLPLADVLGCLKPILEAQKPAKIGQNLKYDQHILANEGIQINGIIGDSMLASYIVESHLGHGLDELAKRHLGLDTITYESLCGKGAKQIGFAEIALAQATEYTVQDADFALRIEAHLRQQMDHAQLAMYRDLELPVANILWQMERDGVLIDKNELNRQSHELGKTLITLESEAHQLAGQPFNLNSPKQLQEILFSKMGIPTTGLKKTAGGAISTNEAALEKLALDYPLPALILQNRSLAKLKSTYTDKLPTLINPKTGRVHTTYAQAVAITGRLASNNPNLQNIPIRTEDGRRVRRAFIAPQGFCVVSADYSQIELRIMAHLSGDETLIEAFQNGDDIHRRTAAEIFGITQENVSNEQRRYAKTINFGLIYGMGQYGLAKSLGIDNAAAKHFIDRYFARYPKVADYMQRTKETAQTKGYVETLFGRRLYLPGIHSKNGTERAGAERAAINAPMQGTASDLIKRAMIAVQQHLQTEHYTSRLIMQVHDELVLEVATAELPHIRQKLPEIMSQAAELSVPLLAEVGVGNNWEEAH